VTAIAQSDHITKWNMLALVAAALGAALTLGLDQLWLHNWARSGVSLPIGQRTPVNLPSGPTIVYYESPVAVPVADATLRVFDADDERIRVNALDGSLNYRLLLSGWSGRALWEVDAPAAGGYTLVCHNHNFLSDSEIPAEDRVVVLKQPNSFKDVALVRTIIQVTGATLTMTSVIILYLLHSLALKKRRALATEA
jgi:hypothetical protein